MSFQTEAVILRLLVAACCQLLILGYRSNQNPGAQGVILRKKQRASLFLGFSGQIPDPMKRYQASIVLKIAFTSLVLAYLAIEISHQA